MSYNYLTEVPINNNASSTVRSLSVDHPDNLFLEGFRLEVGLHELEDLMSEVIIRFDTNPSNYLKDDYLHLIALIIKEFDRLSSLHEKVSILENTDVNIKGDIEANLDRIEEVRGLVINLNTDLRNINNTIQIINSNIDALQAKDSIFTKNIEDINTSILKHIEDYSKEIKDINTTIELLNTNIDTIDSNIEKLFNRKISEGASVENYVCLSVESDADDNTIITLDDTLLKLELDTVDNNISNINTKITEISNVLGKVYKVKGSTTVDNINSMTVGNAMIGYVYNLLDSGVITNGLTGEIPVEAGDNVVYTENGWDKLSAAIKIALEAGNNIAIEGNKINALGYVYDDSRDSVFMVEGSGCLANGYLSFAHGNAAVADGEKAHAEGGQTNASGQLAHAEGSNTRAKGRISHTEGSNTTTYGESSHAEGYYATAIGEASHAEGYNTTSVGAYSHSEGLGTSTRITGLSWVVGSNIVNIENASTNIKINDILKFSRTTVEIKRVIDKYETEIIVDSLIESPTNASVNLLEGVSYGLSSKVEGNCCTAIGNYSHAGGNNTEVKNESEYALGSYNLSNTGTDEDARTTLHSIGIGTSGDDRKNAHEVMNNGDTFIVGIGEYDGTNPYEAKTLQEVINELNNKEIPNEVYVGTTVEGEPIIFIDTDEENDIEVYTKDQVDSLITDVRNEIPNPGVTSFNGETGDINFTIPSTDHLATKEELTTEVNTLNEKISNIVHPEDLVKSVNGLVGEVVISELTAGTNVDITDNIISALGYEFDNELNSVKVGRKLTTEELEEIFGESASTLAACNTSILTAWENGTFSWVKDTNIIQVTDTSLSLPGVIFKVTTNADSILCCTVDRDLPNNQLIVDKDIPFDYIENVSTLDTVMGIAYGKASIAGQATITSGNMAHSEGFATFAHGMSSHSEGIMNWALGDGSHVEGTGNVAYTASAHAEGFTTKAYGGGSHTEGYLTVAEGDYSHAEGKGTQTYNEGEHAEGKYNVSNTTDWIGDTIHSVGIGTSHEDRKNALEVTTQGAVYMKEVGGYDGTTLAGCYPVLLVINALLDSKNNDIPAINKRIDNLNIPTLPENIVNTINGQTGDVVLPDTSTLATKEEVQAVNTRIDELNIPSDLSNVVTKTENYQITLGTDNNATHEKTLLVGTGLTTSNNEALVVGAYNNSEYFVNWGVAAPAIQVGAGSEDSKRTVMVVQKNGKSLGLLGFEQNGFGDFAEYFEWADGNPEGEDRVGYMVLLNEDKIELAESLDNCIGIITGTGAFVADAACLDWHGRYLKDKWGRNIYELTGVLAENPEYDPTKEYIPREYRKEWSPVGLVGKILVRQDGTLKPNGFVGCVNGIATNVDKSSWRVLKVINEEIALVLIK